MLLALLLVGGAVAAPVERRSADSLKTIMLEGHNRARAALGVPTLAWDETLAAHAGAQAQQLVQARRLAHAAQPAGAAREGENLWAGTHGGYAYREMLGDWLAERSAYRDHAAIGAAGQGGGHYSQIAWRGTTRVGCAIASDARTDYLVCRYAPAGNTVGGAAF